MTLRVIVVGLVGALCWGVAPVFGKLGLRNIHPMDGLAARTMVTVAFLVAWVVGTGAIARIKMISFGGWFYLGAEAFLATLAGDLAYYAALKWGSATGAAVVLAASPVVTAWVASVTLNESLTALQFLGVLLVATGILLVAVSGNRM